MKLHRLWAAPVVATVGVAVAFAFQGATGGLEGAADSHRRTAPVAAHVRAVALPTAAAGKVSLAQRTTPPYSLLGVTWTDPAAGFDGTIQARARDAGSGEWSRWLTLESDGVSGDAGRATRGGTDPLWVGPSDGVELRVTTASGTSSRLPKGLRLDLVDPGRSGGLHAEPAAYVAAAATTGPTDTATPTDVATATSTPADTAAPAATAAPTDTAAPADTSTATPTDTAAPADTGIAASTATATSSPTATSASPTSTIPPAPPSTVPRPPIVDRAGWGADESISPEDPIYLPGGVVKAVAVHHTAGTNDYACSESASIVRGIYAYHVQSQGWRDIGYNFLVDKCGTIFEGRKGGVDRPVYGAHTYGWNSETTGISMLGNYNEVAPSTAALTAVARIAGWKLGQYGGDPAGTVTLTAGATQKSLAGRSFVAGTAYTFPQVFGHRDGVATECPGDNLWAKLPTIRTWAAGPVQGLAITSLSGSVRSGTTYYTKGAVTVKWTATTPSSLISRFEVLVDGKVAATAGGSATSAGVTLAAGQHSVQVRAVHQTGKAATTAALTVVGDTTAPYFSTRPWMSLRGGTVNTSAVPVTLRWRAVDNAALRSVSLTAPTTGTYGPTVTSHNYTAKSGTSTTWAMRALDYAGNTGTASVGVTPVILQESAAVRSGSWTARYSSYYLGGRSYSSKSRGASLTWTFTGRSVAWVVSRASSSGQAYVYVDGTRVATVDLRSSTPKYRQAIWARTWSSSAKHTVKIVVLGTSGRPTVTTDGLVYLR
ncbi:MAG TPA: peptidoglycan recognition protein [Actinomycetes bacterium]